MPRGKPIWERVRDGEVVVTGQKILAVQRAIDAFMASDRRYGGMPEPASGLALCKTEKSKTRATWRFVAQTRAHGKDLTPVANLLGKKTLVGTWPEMSVLDAMKVRDKLCLEYAEKLRKEEEAREKAEKTVEKAIMKAQKKADAETDKAEAAPPEPETPPPLVGPELPRNFLERLTALMPVLPLMPERTQKGLVDALVHAEDSGND